MSVETANVIERTRERNRIVKKLLEEEQRHGSNKDPQVRDALAGLVEALRAEGEKLDADLVALLRETLQDTSDQVAKALGLNEQHAESYRTSTVAAPYHKLSERDMISHRDRDNSDLIMELDEAIVEQGKLLRWIEQAKGG